MGGARNRKAQKKDPPRGSQSELRRIEINDRPGPEQANEPNVEYHSRGDFKQRAESRYTVWVAHRRQFTRAPGVQSFQLDAASFSNRKSKRRKECEIENGHPQVFHMQVAAMRGIDQQEDEPDQKPGNNTPDQQNRQHKPVDGEH